MTDDEWDRQLAEERHATGLPPRDETERHLMNEILVREYDPMGFPPTPALWEPPPPYPTAEEITAEAERMETVLAQRAAAREFAARYRAGEPPRNDAEREQYREWHELDADVVDDYFQAQAERIYAGREETEAGE